MLKYPCLVLDHDDTVVKSEITVNYPCFLESLERFRPGETMGYQEFEKEENWQIRKLGQWIDAKGVSSSPLLHATDMGVRNDEVEIECVDSMLVAPYGRRLLDNERDPQNQDMYFNLYNNIWGCNHPMWYSDDSIFRFTIRKIDV